MKSPFPFLFDSHCHLNFNAFKNDADQIVEQCLANNVWLIIVGTQYDTSKKAVELASKYGQGVYASIGIHPIHLKETLIDETEIDPLAKFKSRAESFNQELYQKLLVKNKVIAIGEIGLDYKYAQTIGDKNLQKNEFIKQAYFAFEHSLPIIIHCREAYCDLLDILKSEFKNKNLTGVSHFFSGSITEARTFLELGFKLSFAGPITYSNDRHQVIKYVPLDHILVETDSPYVAPVPYRGKRNIPLYVEVVVQKIAQIKKLPIQVVAQITAKNALKLFNINVSYNKSGFNDGIF